MKCEICESQFSSEDKNEIICSTNCYKKLEEHCE